MPTDDIVPQGFISVADLAILTCETTSKKIPYLKVVQGYVVGKLPSEVLDGQWAGIGHVKSNLLGVIRAKCLDCSHTHPEVAHCTAVTCALWPYRMRSNPFRTEKTPEQRARASAVLNAYHNKLSKKVSDKG